LDLFVFGLDIRHIERHVRAANIIVMKVQSGTAASRVLDKLEHESSGNKMSYFQRRAWVVGERVECFASDLEMFFLVISATSR